MRLRTWIGAIIVSHQEVRFCNVSIQEKDVLVEFAFARRVWVSAKKLFVPFAGDGIGGTSASVVLTRRRDRLRSMGVSVRNAMGY